MNPKLLKAVVLALVALAPAVAAFSQSLADAAKKERARRKTTAPAAAPKVYTESDLPTSPAGATPEPEAKGEGDQATVTPAVPKARKKGLSSEESKQLEIAGYRARAAEIQGRMAQIEAVVKQLANHPTGGGRVCRIAEGVFRPGETAPEQVVCPYQMETRYEEAKRALDSVQAQLTALKTEATRRGISF